MMNGEKKSAQILYLSRFFFPSRGKTNASSHLIMMRHRVFSTVSGSPLLFWIFRMSVERRRREDTVVVVRKRKSVSVVF